VIASANGRRANTLNGPARAPAGIVFNEHTDEDAAVLFRHACKLGLEGIVSKRLGAIGSRSRTRTARRW
jgi:ATP-dependent DNA ligase